MDSLVVLGSALALGAPLALAPWPCATLAAWVAWRLLREKRWRLVLVASAVLVLGNWRARHQLRAHETRRAQLADDFRKPRPCEGRGTVVASPTKGDLEARVLLEAHTLECGELGKLALGPLGVSLHVGGDMDDAAQLTEALALRRGDEVLFDADLGLPLRFLNADLPDPRPREVARGIALSGHAPFLATERRGFGLRAGIDSWRRAVRQRIERHFDAAQAPMARALVLGEQALDADDSAAFAESGLSHLLAVSGMHLVLAIATLERALRAMAVRIEALAGRLDVRRPLAMVAAAASLFYADFAGGSGSAWRAALAACFAHGALAGGRRMQPARALGGAVAVMALLDPMVAYDMSFSLSVAATAGLLAFGKTSDRLAQACRVPAVIRGMLAPTLAATLPCSMVLARFTSALPSLALGLNLVAIPLSELAALPLCLGFSVVPDWPPLLRGMAQAAGGALQLTLWVARWGRSLPRLPVPLPSAWQCVVLAALLIELAALCLRDRDHVARRAPRHRGSVLVVALLGLELLLRRPPGHLQMTHIDVGQGDATLIDLPDGSAMLVDAGGLIGTPLDVGERVIAPLLRARRRDRLRLLVLSHPHPDHYGGFEHGLRDVRIDEFWDTAAEPDDPHDHDHEPSAAPRPGVPRYDAFRARMAAQAVPVRPASAVCGRHTIGGAELVVLAPCPLAPEEGANDNSFVIRVQSTGSSLLLVGDAEHNEESRVLASDAAQLHADVLKVGHHGSRTSTTPSFLAAVRPKLAVISAGNRNRFGHPHPQTLDTLDRAQVAVARTDRLGGFTLRWHGERLLLEAADFAR